MFAHDEELLWPQYVYDAEPRTDWQLAMSELERVAVEADAEPGWHSGLHVHVGKSHLDTYHRNRLLYAFMKWEPVLVRFAAGRFPHQREGMNHTVRDSLSYMARDAVGTFLSTYPTSAWEALNGVHETDDTEARDEILDRWWHYHYEADRHTNFNTRTRRPTVEFRLWNSTRSAWRMEMFTRLSVALVDPTVIDALAVDPPKRQATVRAMRDLTTTIGALGHDRCAELMERQVDYIASDAATNAPSSFTIV